MTRWGEAMLRVVGDYTVGTVVVLAHLVMVGFERPKRDHARLLTGAAPQNQFVRSGRMSTVPTFGTPVRAFGRGSSHQSA